MRSLFHLLLEGLLLVNGDYGICMDFPPPTSKNEDKNSKFAWSHSGEWVMRSLLHLINTPTLINGDYEICMELSPPTSKKLFFFIQKLEICLEPLRRMGYEVSFAFINWGTPPSLVNGDYEICMNLPLETSKKAAFYIQKLEICMKPLRRVGYEVSFPTFNGRTPLVNRDY